MRGLRVPRQQPFVVLEHVIERAVDDGAELGMAVSPLPETYTGHTSDATMRAAFDGLPDALGLS